MKLQNILWFCGSKSYKRPIVQFHSLNPHFLFSFFLFSSLEIEIVSKLWDSSSILYFIFYILYFIYSWVELREMSLNCSDFSFQPVSDTFHWFHNFTQETRKSPEFSSMFSPGTAQPNKIQLNFQCIKVRELSLFYPPPLHRFELSSAPVWDI